MSSLLLVLAALGPYQEPALVRSLVATEAPVWVGQRVRFDVRLLVPNQFSGTPTFDVPEVENAIFVRVGGSNSRPTFGSEREGGTSYTSATYSFAAFFQRDGAFTIPPFEVRFASLEGFGVDPEWHALDTQEHRVEVRSPPGTERLAVVISATRLDVDDRWDRATDGARVGDAFRRTVRMSAPDVSGLLLPPLPLDRVTGLAARLADPAVETETARGAFRGTREQEVTYLCEEPGTAVVPPMVVRWWNLDTGTLEAVELAGATFEIAEAPTPPPQDDVTEAAPTRGPRRWSPAVLGGAFVALVGALGVALWRRIRTPLTRWLQTRRLRRLTSESGRFQQLTAALQRDDAAAAMAALYRWLAVRPAARRPATLRELQDEVGDPGLAAELDALERAVLDGDRAGPPWSGAALARCLVGARDHLDRAESGTAHADLPPLNPGTGPS
ncbi:MAG: hypothetical protein AAF957_08085 [Planctomycetota bacterium]